MNVLVMHIKYSIYITFYFIDAILLVLLDYNDKVLDIHR